MPFLIDLIGSANKKPAEAGWWAGVGTKQKWGCGPGWVAAFGCVRSDVGPVYEYQHIVKATAPVLAEHGYDIMRTGSGSMRRCQEFCVLRSVK
ncbi:hypothetical protein D8I24_0305 (plasmid) [Cupriavidus necator H850]|nr:hypothetical protein D8I24_0305 [Cupriavidus necator H850]